MKNFFNLLKRMTVTLLIAAALIGNTKICVLPDSHHEISTFSEDDIIFWGYTPTK